MRLFIGIDIPNKLREKIAEMQKELKNVKIVEKGNLHITLKFLGNVDDVERVINKLKEIDFQRFSINLRRVGTFPNENYIKVVWIGCNSPELVQLVRIVDQRMSEIGFPKEGRYVPHLTIARVKRKPTEDLRKFLKKYNSVDLGSFVVSKIKLKKSTLTPRGPIYEDIFSKSLQ